MNKELELLLLAVLRNKSDEEKQKISELLQQELNWGNIAGQALHHRLGGYFYFGLEQEQRKAMFPEFMKALDLIVKAQAQQARELKELMDPILVEMNALDIRYAGLKGLVFNTELYQLGERRSNDTDILVLEDDLNKLDEMLRRRGYIQSLLPNGEYKEATRKEKMIQRMNYHDLVPYIKEVNSPFLKHHVIDVNFHYDSKDNEITGQVFEIGTQLCGNDDHVKRLPWETHLGQLCIHFYREGTNSIWSSGRRDVVLYKVVDVINTIRLAEDESQIMRWVSLMKELKLEKACYYTLHHIMEFYKGIVSDAVLEQLKPNDLTYLDEIEISGSDDVQRRTKSFMNSAFDLTFKRDVV
jgi:hypothetical protein